MAANLDTTLDRLGTVKDVLTVQRVFGEAYTVDGVTVIPVATVRGGGGGGGGSGTDGDAAQGSGAGVGFGVQARPAGVYVVRDGDVSWRPAVDPMRIILGGQILGLVAILTIRRLLARRS